LEAVRLVFRGELRRRWRSWVALALLITLVAGLVLAATAAGRRTASAFPRFVAAYGYDALVYSGQPLPQLVRLPEVASDTTWALPINGPPRCNTCTHSIGSVNNFNFLVGQRAALSRVVKLAAGHMPDPSAPEQVLASFTLQQDYGVHIGTVIRVPLFASSQRSALSGPNAPAPTGPTVALRVVGIAAAEGEFPSGSAPTYDLYATGAFARTVLPQTTFATEYLVRLRHGAADLPRFLSEANANALGVIGAQGQDDAAAAVEASIHPQAVGWWILALLTALAGLVVIGQALSRQTMIESEEHPTLAALGMDQRQLVLLGMARNLLVGLGAAAGAVALAIALSPLAPVGEARLADPSSGVTFDPVVLLLGGLATVALVMALGTSPVIRAAHRRRTEGRSFEPKPSVLVARVAAVGAPPSAVVGVRHAVERGRGPDKVPVSTALLGTALAVMALSATAVFGASLSHLTATPNLYGDAFQLNINNPGGSGVPDPAVLASLKHDPAVAGVTFGMGNEIVINKVPVASIAATAIRGPLLFTRVDGRLPNGDGQIALGATTMRRVGAHLGSVVQVTVQQPAGGQRTVPFRVVSRVALPVLGGTGGLGTGAVLTIAAYQDAVCPPGPGQMTCRSAVSTNSSSGILVSVVPGAQGRAAIAHYLNAYSQSVALPVKPTSLVNFGDAVNFPLIFGAVLALFGAATLVHLLVVSVSRRRREIGLLKALGFVNHQVAAAVGWQATTVALVGIIVGIPLGVLVGRVAWDVFATNLGVVAVPVVQTWLLAVLVVGVLVVANLFAIAPALVATRSKPNQLLRAQ